MGAPHRAQGSREAAANEKGPGFPPALSRVAMSRAAYEQPLVEPQSMHLVQVPLRTIAIEPQVSHGSPV